MSETSHNSPPLYSMPPIQVSQAELGAILLSPGIEWPNPPDFWAYGRRTHLERTCPNLCVHDPQTKALKKYREKLKKLLEDLLDDMTHDDMTLIGSFVGGGKTTTTAQVLNARKYRLAWFVETHEQADEVAHLFRDREVVTLRSRKGMVKRGELQCNYLEHFEDVNPLAVPTICDNPAACGKLKECEYHKRRQAAVRQNTEVVIATHSHLKSHALLRDIEVKGQYHIWVIDENFLLSCAKERKVPATKLTEYTNLLNVIMREGVSGAGEKFCQDAIKTCDYLLSWHGKEDYFVCEQMARLYIPREITSALQRHAADHFKRKNHLVPDFTELIIEAVTDSLNFCWEGDELVFVQRPNLPSSVPTLFLDAEGCPRQYSEVLGKSISGRNVEAIFNPPQTARIVQFKDGAYGKTSFFKYDPANSRSDDVEGFIPAMGKWGLPTFHKMLKLIETIVNKHKSDTLKIALITNKALEPYFRCFIRSRFPEFNLLPEEAKRQGSRDDIEHFYNLRGTNAYGKHTVLIVIGTPFLPPKVMVNYVSRLYNLYDKERLKLLLEEAKPSKNDKKGWGKVQFKSGESKTVKAISYNDLRLQSVYEIRVLKEIYQAIGRIRPYRPLEDGEEVTVYLVTNVPIRWYKVEKPRPGTESFIKSPTAPSHPSHREKLTKIAVVIKELPPSFKTKQFYEAYEARYGALERKPRATLRKLMIEHASSLDIEPPAGKQQTFKRLPGNGDNS